LILDNDVFIALVGVGGTLAGSLLGWGLTLATEKTRGKGELARKKNAIKAELVDMSVRTQLGEHLAKDECDRYMNGFVERVRNHPNPYEFEILAQYFKEISHSLSETERRNIYILKGQITSANNMISNFATGSSSPDRLYNYGQRFNVYQTTLVLNRFLNMLVEQGLETKIELNSGALKEGLDTADEYHKQSGIKLGVVHN